MTEFTKWISENMLIISAVLYVLGLFIKQIPKIPNWTIPFILTFIGIAFGWTIEGFPQGIIQGILCAGAAVLANELITKTIDHC